MLQCERKRLLSLNLQIAVTLRLHQCYRRENRGVKRRKRYYHQVKVCQDLSGWICDRHKHDKLQIVNNTNTNSLSLTTTTQSPHRITTQQGSLRPVA